MNAKPISVAILDDFQNVARSFADWSPIEPRAQLTVFNDHVTGDALVKRLEPFDVVMAIRERTAFPRAVIDRLPRLRLLVTAGMRNLGIDLDACRQRGVLVCGTPTGSAPTAELAFGLVLALSRHITHEDRALREGRWQTRLGRGVAGSTLGIVGLGRLGAQTARYAQAFGMRTIAWSQNLTDARAAEHGCERVDKPELFQRADFVSLHLILAERTRGVVGAPEIGAMKPTAYLVNTSRAGLLDEAALIAALHAGRIAGAALDVYSEEPLPPNAAIRAAPNTILTPHLGYATRESYEAYFPGACEDIEAWLAGAPIRVLS
jgi:phosphoglycerate dehydrogenase-like enzyme